MTRRSKSGAQWHAEAGVPLFRLNKNLPAGVVKHTTLAVQGIKMRLVDAGDPASLIEAIQTYRK